MIRRRDGYTLMELLTVIAIISVLAGLIFPVASSAKRRARQAQCMNNMYQIFTAIKQFQLDEHRYPEFIAGPVQWNTGTAVAPVIVYADSGTLVPLEYHTGMMYGSTGGNGRQVALFPEYIPSIATLKCPFTDLNGDDNRKYTTGAMGDPPVAVPQDIVDDPMFTVLSGTNATRALGVNGTESDAFSLYKYSSYDYQKPPGMTIDEVHYSVMWSNAALTDPNVPRQLKWRTPPEETVVTWCSHHRSSDSSTGVPQTSSKDICLFLDGHVKQVPSLGMEPFTNGWLAPP